MENSLRKIYENFEKVVNFTGLDRWVERLPEQNPRPKRDTAKPHLQRCAGSRTLKSVQQQKDHDVTWNEKCAYSNNYIISTLIEQQLRCSREKTM